MVFPTQDSWVDFEHRVVFSPDGQWVARGSQAGQVSLWRTDEPLLSLDFGGDGSPIYAVDWSPDGKFFAAGSRLGYIKVWDVVNERELVTLTHRPVHTLRYSPNGHFLASGGDDCSIRIWDVNPGNSTFGKCSKVLKVI